MSVKIACVLVCCIGCQSKIFIHSDNVINTEVVANQNTHDTTHNQPSLSIPASGPITCGDGVCAASENCSNCPQDCNNPITHQACQRVGLFYSALQLYAFHAAQLELQYNNPVLTVESILRSRSETTAGLVAGAHNFVDIWSPNAKKLSARGYYLYTPQTGFYCLYKPRTIGQINYDPNFDTGLQLECPTAESILTQHASMISQLGVDYVVLDGTNIPVYSRSANGLQLRPFELMVETWYAGRQSGVSTPDVAMWQAIPVGGNIWQNVLNIYNAYPNMIMKDRHTGKMVMFYKPQTADPALIEQIEANGGRNNIIAVPMWTLNPNKPAQWSFLTSCANNKHYLIDGPCDQAFTPASVLGSQLAITPMSPYRWPSVGGMQGTTGFAQGIYVRKQFVTAMQKQPDYLLLSSWNEHVSGMVNFNNAGLLQGFEIDATYINNGNRPFIDNYSVEYSRNIEPSVEYGSRVYNIVQSCLRVFRTGATTCNNPQELCCQGGDYSDWYTIYHGPNQNDDFVLYAPTLKPTDSMQVLYLCNTASASFFSNDRYCEGISTTSPSMLLGFVSTIKGGETLRTLRRCKTGYAVGVLCADGSFGNAILGYVR